jgi:hypothetical protein
MLFINMVCLTVALASSFLKHRWVKGEPDGKTADGNVIGPGSGSGSGRAFAVMDADGKLSDEDPWTYHMCICETSMSELNYTYDD